MKFLSNLTTNQRLALLAFVLGLVAIGATPTRGGRVSIDSREMALLMQNGADRVDVQTLAGWIVESRADVRLVDVRAPAAFAAGPRIPSSENIPVASLIDAGLARDERIVLVSDDEAQAAQAWFLLRSNGYRGAVIARGSVRAWQEEVVFPNLDGLDAARRARVSALSEHFGGAPRSAASASPIVTPPPPPAPQTAVTRAPAGTAKKPGPAKKREGC